MVQERNSHGESNETGRLAGRLDRVEGAADHAASPATECREIRPGVWLCAGKPGPRCGDCGLTRRE